MPSESDHRIERSSHRRSGTDAVRGPLDGRRLADLGAAHALPDDSEDDSHPNLERTRPDADQPTPVPPTGNDPVQLGSYRILRRLGVGGMGTVYLAYDPQAHRQVALKVLAAAHAAVPSYLRRFQREGQSGAALIHPHIVRTFGAFVDERAGLHYLVLEHVDGPSAHELLDRLGRLAVSDAVAVARDVARALAYAHENNFIHRDVKPANILIGPDGRARLSDLGLAKRTDEISDLTSARGGLGTPYYIPYEQAMSGKQADARSDVFALGATLYHMLTGVVPFPGASDLEVVDRKAAGVYRPAQSLNPHVPSQLERVLARALARLPADRYSSGREMLEALESCGLAAAIPSFAGTAAPHVLADPSQPTCHGVGAQGETPAPGSSAEQGWWFVRYRDRHGNVRTAKLVLVNVLNRLRSGTLPPDAELSRRPDGDFQPLTSVAALQEAVAEARSAAAAPIAPAPPANAEQGAFWSWLLIGAAALLLLGGALAVALLR